MSEETKSNLSVTVVPSSRYNFDHQGCFQLSLLLRTSLSNSALLLNVPHGGPGEPVELRLSPASFFTVFYEP